MTTSRGRPRVRVATVDDLPAIARIANDFAERTATNFATEPEPLADWVASWRGTSVRYPWLVAEGDDGVIVGFAKASPHRTRGAYRRTAEVTVYIEPAHQGCGVGRALYTQLIDMLRERGFVTLLAGIALPNDASVRLHESLGFAYVGTFRKVGWKLGRWHDVGYWQLVFNEGQTT